ncbi:MAG: P-II family nitrogen regulator [Acidobacteria bacterium]|jgi:nitrogen regulatory protein P-II 1|nr:P-II family nitrogen regulator [Acidobacteriota bacterium]MCW5949426.1 P-II family nitrogen regulator [Pyrinomonadaceae bacterium]
MKLIVAVVRPFKLDEIVTALEEIEGFPGMTVIDSEGFGQRLRNTATDAVDPFKPNKRIEIAANDEMIEDIVATIRQTAHTGKKGDGIIVVVPVESGFII